MSRKNPASKRLRAVAVVLLAAAGVLAATPTPLALPNLPPTFDSGTLIVAPAPSLPVLDGAVDGVWSAARPLEVTAFGASGSWPTGAGVSVRALHDNTTLFLLIEWDDATEDYSRDAWLLFDNQTYDGVWTRTTWGDDALGIFFANASGGDANFTAAGCGPMCHTSAVNEMRTDAGVLDTWLWSSSLSAPLGYTRDMYLDNRSKLTGSLTGGLHPDGGNSFSDNSVLTPNGTRPAFFNSSVPVAESARHIASADASPFNWLALNATSLPKGLTLPGYVLSAPTGGDADVGAGASYSGSRWTVEMSRPLSTGDDPLHDVDVLDLNATYFFNLAVFNNQTGINSSNAGFVRKMIFADNAMSDLTVESVTPQQASTLLGDPVNLTVRVQNMGFGASAGAVFVSITDDTSALQVANGSVPAVSSADFFLLNLSFSSLGYTPGAHSFTASVDTANSEPESFENNNTRTFLVTFVALVAPSDLELETADGPAATVFGGESFVVNGSVRNIGAGDTVLNVTVDGGHPLFGNVSQDVGPLLAGEAANYTLVFNATGVPRGSYAISVRADPANLLVEDREDNNMLVVVVAVEDRSDLFGAGIVADPAAALDGTQVNVTITVDNRGAPFAGSIEVWIYLDDGVSTGASNRSAIWNVPLDLRRGERAIFTSNWTIPLGLFIGNHTLRAFIDAPGALDEVSETNNNATVQFIVLAPPKPDLFVASVTTGAASYRTGETGNVTVTVSNQGTAYVGNVRLEVVEASVNRSLGNITVPALAPNESRAFTLTFGVPPGTAGTHSILAFVDADNFLDEERELNNALATVYTLLPPAVQDLWIASASQSPALPRVGTTVTVSLVVRNAGTAPSTAGTSVALHWASTAIGVVQVPALSPGEDFTATFLWDTVNVSSLAPILTASIAVPGGNPDDQSNNVHSFTVTLASAGSSRLRVDNVTASPSSVPVNGVVSVGARILNEGTAAGSGFAVLVVAGRDVESVAFTLQPGENRTVRFNWTAAGSGPVTLAVQVRTGTPVQIAGEAASSVTVTSLAPPGSPPWALIGVAIAVAASVGLILLMRRRDQSALRDQTRSGEADRAPREQRRDEEE